ncbi:hypothetical protein M3E00_05255 [Dietzia cinnamea]|nr:hypothetical protein [Dietzia cinnamea]KZO58414.1 hypothetical protein A2U19_11930 [Dietzia maris]MCT2097997.1 hypothetical protein [Dietzia cinnamea]
MTVLVDLTPVVDGTGPARRHGPHHGAHTSTSTGMLDSSTTAWKSASFASTTQGSGVLHFPQRGVPSATTGMRFLAPQFPHTTVVVL